MATKPKARGKAKKNRRKPFSKNTTIHTLATARARLGAQRGEPRELRPATAVLLVPIEAAPARFRLTATAGKQNAIRPLSGYGLLRRVSKSTRVAAQTVSWTLPSMWLRAIDVARLHKRRFAAGASYDL